jgi:hypothetical protein
MSTDAVISTFENSNGTKKVECRSNGIDYTFTLGGTDGSGSPFVITKPLSLEDLRLLLGCIEDVLWQRKRELGI